MTEPIPKNRKATEQATPRDRLWWIVAAPSTWAIHFLACYLTVAIWCEKHGGGDGLGAIGGLVAAYTVVALSGIGIIGWHSFRKHQFGSGELPHDEGTAADRHRLVGFASLLLALLSVIATIFTALAFVFIRSCD